MKTFKSFSLGYLFALLFSVPCLADDLQAAIQNGSVNGNIRAYYNTREYEDSAKTDEAAFALGGALRAETAEFYHMKFGLGYYTAQDLGTNNDDPSKVNKRLGSELEVLGEAYLSTTIYNTTVVAGRQKINTPFANAGDAFIIPFTFEAFSLKNTALADFTFEAAQINSIKNRNSDEFVDVGIWSSSRYGITPTSTSGTTTLGASYKKDSLSAAFWYYRFADLFDMVYGEFGYTLPSVGDFSPFIDLQLLTQSESGDELLGTVDATLYGIRVGFKVNNSALSIAFNNVAEEDNSFNNGAILTPYNFSTSPLFTNNMLTTFENVDAGDATKITFNHKWNAIAFKVSYAMFDYAQAVDRNATDIDLTFPLDQWQPGLSFRYRLEVVDADEASVEQTNHRLQLQLTF